MANFGFRVLVKENPGSGEKPVLSQSEVFPKKEDAWIYAENAVEKFLKFHPSATKERKDSFNAIWVADQDWSATLSIFQDYVI